MILDPRTPVIVGAGQASERLGQPGYRRRSPVDLAAGAAREAILDTGAGAGASVDAGTSAGTAGNPAAVAAAIDTVAGIRQFENSTPGARAPLGRSDNYPRSVAGRVGANPARAILEVTGGQGPQHVVNEFAAAIAAGRGDVVLLFGSEAISTIEHFANRAHYAKADKADRPDFTEHAEGSLEDRGYGLEGIISAHLAAHGLIGAPSQYALIENARRARLKQTRQLYAAAMGALFAPFTRVAAANPHASAPVERTAAELVTPTEANRPIADPYTRYIVAREKVNQGAAVLLMSVAAARRLGVPEDRWVFLHGHADLRERPLMERADLSRSPAALSWPASRRATWPPSTCTPASPRRCSTSARDFASSQTTRAASRSPAGCRSSAARATTTRCTPSPRPCGELGPPRVRSASSAPTAAS
jgi:acetyl-CoA C-acetyltransferase